MESSLKGSSNDKNTVKSRSAADDTTDSVDVNNSFDDIKRKLRLVLSNTTSQTPQVIKVGT